jgi:hypothetical protein
MSPEEARTEAIRRIEQARAEGATLLDLGDLPLDDLPEQLGSLSELRVLALGMFAARPGKDGVEWEFDGGRRLQRFSDLGPLAGLPALQSLDLSGCEGVSDLS